MALITSTCFIWPESLHLTALTTSDCINGPNHLPPALCLCPPPAVPAVPCSELRCCRPPPSISLTLDRRRRVGTTTTAASDSAARPCSVDDRRRSESRRLRPPPAAELEDPRRLQHAQRGCEPLGELQRQ